MRKLLLIILLYVPLLGFTQHTLSDSDMIKIDSLFQVYEQTDSLQKLEIHLLNTQVANYKRLHEQDSVEIYFLNEKTNLLTQRVELYIDLTNELKPKWYNKPVINFFLGAATIVTASWVVSNVN
jgi:hypothetical protein